MTCACIRHGDRPCQQDLRVIQRFPGIHQRAVFHRQAKADVQPALKLGTKAHPFRQAHLRMAIKIATGHFGLQQGLQLRCHIGARPILIDFAGKKQIKALPCKARVGAIEHVAQVKLNFRAGRMQAKLAALRGSGNPKGFLPWRSHGLTGSMAGCGAIVCNDDADALWRHLPDLPAIRQKLRQQAATHAHLLRLDAAGAGERVAHGHLTGA